MAGRFLAIAAVGVIGLLVGLWVLMHDSGPPLESTAAPHDAAVTATVAPTRPTTVPPSVRTVPIAPVVLHRPTVHETPSNPGTAPALEVADAPAKPLTIDEALKEQVLLTETQVLECNDKALKAGKKLDGEAAYGFTVARKDGKIVIESTGVEYTNFDPVSSDCFKDTAYAMTFDSLPDGVDAVTGYRKVVLSDGALKRQWMTMMTVVRPPPRTP